MDVVTAKALEQVNCKTQTWKTEPEILVGLELHKNKIKSVSIFYALLRSVHDRIRGQENR